MNNMSPSFTRQGENQRSTRAYKNKLKYGHGPVKTVNKTGLIKLNRSLRKKGNLNADDFGKVGYKDVDMTDHKPPVKKKW